MTFTIQESIDIFHFGPFFSSFSTHINGESGWFYGDHSDTGLFPQGYPWSNADVANAGPVGFDVDLLSLSFSDTYVSAAEGDTVVFQRDGAYAAWTLTSFDGCEAFACSTLTAEWAMIAPEPSAFPLLAIGLAFLTAVRRV